MTLVLPPSLDAQTVFVPAGSLIFRQGEAGDCAYVIEEGVVEIAEEGSARPAVTLRRSGEVIGEVADAGRGLRRASATALFDCRLLRVSAARLARQPRGADPVLPPGLDGVLGRLREALALAGRGPAADGEPVENATLAMLRTLSQARREDDLRRALANGEIVLFFQPIVSLTDGDIVGFEGLARWRHPERGLLEPAEFVPLAEAAGLAGALTRVALARAVEAFARLDAATAPGSAPLFVAVNVSGEDLIEGDLPGMLAEVTRADPSLRRRLKIEITEGALTQEAETVVATLERCRALGVGIAVDDVGTGSSSLSRLQDLPVDALKIDRSFVQTMGSDAASAAIVRTILALAGDLNLPVVSKGLEGGGDAGALATLGCGFGQGFRFARPMPVEDCASLLARWRHSRNRRAAELAA